MLLLHLAAGDHGDRSTKLLGSHKPCYNGQWPLTSRYFKLCQYSFLVFLLFIGLFTYKIVCWSWYKKILYFVADGIYHHIPVYYSIQLSFNLWMLDNGDNNKALNSKNRKITRENHPNYKVLTKQYSSFKRNA